MFHEFENLTFKEASAFGESGTGRTIRLLELCVEKLDVVSAILSLYLQLTHCGRSAHHLGAYGGYHTLYLKKCCYPAPSQQKNI